MVSAVLTPALLISNWTCRLSCFLEVIKSSKELPPPPTHTHWCGLASWHEPLGPLRLKLAQAKALAAGQVRRGGGCPGALWNSGAELGPKALRHAFDHKNGGGGGQSLFLESSKAGDFCGLVQSLALVPLAPSRATFSCTQAPPTDV